MKTISYLVFGKKREYQLELTYSVLSAVRYLRRRPADIRIVLITQEGDGRPDLPIEHVYFSKEEFKRWSGTSDNVHRVKEFALTKVLETYGGVVAHIDPDTYFLDHPERLFDNVSEDSSVMHENEGPLSTHAIWKPILDSGVREVMGYPVTPEACMYNSGVVGLHYDNRHLLMESVALEDRLYEISPVFNIEQFATGAVLEKHTKLFTCKPMLAHYWGSERRFINAQCDELFPTFTREVFEKFVDAESLPHVGYPKISLVDKLAARVKLGRLAVDGDYRFAYIAYRSALRTADQNAKYANLWAKIALERLQHFFERVTLTMPVRQSMLDRDFRDFGAQQLPRLGWLEPSIRSAWTQLSSAAG